MKKSVLILFAVSGLALISCSKRKCSQCHYDKNGQEIELGEYCGDDREKLEADGYNDNGTVYEAHCGEH